MCAKGALLVGRIFLEAIPTACMWFFNIIDRHRSPCYEYLSNVSSIAKSYFNKHVDGRYRNGI